MQRKKSLWIILLISLIVIFMLGSYIYRLESYGERSIVIHNYKLDVAIPKSLAAYQKGLSGRKTLAENQGMLFIFKKEAYWPFWMPQMHFPVDIVWLDKDCQVVYIQKSLPPCERTTNCPQVVPHKPAQFVLETVAGFTDKYHVVLGENLDICKNIR